MAESISVSTDTYLWFPYDPQEGRCGSSDGQRNVAVEKPLGETYDEYFSKLGALEVKSFNFGVANDAPDASQEANARQARFGHLNVTRNVDLASTRLTKVCASGAYFPDMLLAIRKPGGDHLLYLQYIFRKVYVVSIGWSRSADAYPEETLDFAFTAMGFRYVSQGPDGRVLKTIEVEWNHDLNVADLNVPSMKKNAMRGPLAKYADR